MLRKNEVSIVMQPESTGNKASICEFRADCMMASARNKRYMRTCWEVCNGLWMSSSSTSISLFSRSLIAETGIRERALLWNENMLGEERTGSCE